MSIRSPPSNVDAVVTLPKLSATLTSEPPDASNWSVADVAEYFTDVGFVDQAEAFRAEASISCWWYKTARLSSEYCPCIITLNFVV